MGKEECTMRDAEILESLRYVERAETICHCDDDRNPADDAWLLSELEDGDFKDDPCPYCGGRILQCPSVWMVEEEEEEWEEEEEEEEDEEDC
jgi:hypothetical protein